MVHTAAVVLAFAGFVAVCWGVFLLSTPLGFMAAGVCLVWSGRALEAAAGAGSEVT